MLYVRVFHTRSALLLRQSRSPFSRLQAIRE